MGRKFILFSSIISQSHHERSDIYRLQDDDEEDVLTHMGQNLGDIENFDDAGLQLTDEEDNNGNSYEIFLF